MYLISWISLNKNFPSLTCVFLSASNCEQIGKRTVKRWKIGIFGIISTAILWNEIIISAEKQISVYRETG